MTHNHGVLGSSPSGTTNKKLKSCTLIERVTLFYLTATRIIDMHQSRSRQYSNNEELINSASHALGIIFGLVAAYIFFSKESILNNKWAVLSVAIYLFGMLVSYITSTWYHATKEGRTKWILQKFDHASIYLHIAGTYTPFTLVTMREEGMWGWALFTFIWLAAIVGVIVSFTKSGKHNYIETACYVIMGCSILVAFNPLINSLSASERIDALVWLVLGGVSYIVGAVFYSFAKIKYLHTVFHFFVLGGSICHIISIYKAL